MTTQSTAAQMTSDLRHALRLLWKNRGVNAIAVLSLAMGIGASTVLFSFAYAFLFRPIAALDAAALVQVFTSGFEGSRYGGSSYADYADFRDRSRGFSGLLASTRARATLSDQDRPDQVPGALVSGNYFDVLGLRPSLGRFFLPDENRTPGTHPVVVLSHEAWLRRFAADPAVVGRRIGLNGHAFTVIGIGPPKFAGTSIEHTAEFFAPVMMQSAISPTEDVLRDRRARVFRILGRLNPGVEPRDADAALQVVAGQLALEDPEAWLDKTGRGRVVTVLSDIEARFAGMPSGALALILSGVMGGVLVLLGVACVNVATVLLARATARRKEMAVRLALGASRTRLVRQLLTESALLAGAGGALGLAMAQWTAALFARFRPDGAPPIDLTIDYRIFAFGVAASMATVVLFGLAPALHSTRADVNAELKGQARATRVRRFRLGLRDALVVVQVAVSLALVIGAGLLFRSLYTSLAQDPEFRRDGVLNVAVDLSTITASGSAHAAFYRDAVRSVAGVPGVERVALAALVPLDGSTRHGDITIDTGGSPTEMSPDINVVGPGYFALMDIPVVQGREFALADRPGAPEVAVVNEVMARRLAAGSAVGLLFRDNERKLTVQVVGVVRNLHHRFLNESPRPMVYFPADQRPGARMTLHVRTAAPLAVVATAAVRALHEISPAAALAPPQTMAEHMDFVMTPQRLGGLAAAATGLVELILAVMALYGVIAFAAAQRKREIGLRMALGASATSVTRLIMRDGLVLAGLGLGLGVVIAMAAAPAMGELLIGVSPVDPVSFGAATALVLLVAAAASYVPARRASRLEPSVALRSE